MSRRRENIWLLTAIICAIIVAIGTFTSMLTDPGHTILGLGGDSGKNYTAYLYHSLYETGAWSYVMNYPYGDNILYMDGQPLLSITLGYINAIIPLNHQFVLAFMHIALGFSFVLAIIYTYKILRLKTAPWFAIIFSLLIIVLSPQMIRFGGHFGLAHLFVIPMLFYYTLKYHAENKVKYPLYIFIVGTAAGFLHPYFLGILLIWILLYTIALFIFTKDKFIEKIKKAIPLIISLACILAVAKLYLFLTDPIPGRPKYPDGTLLYITSQEHIFTSQLSTISVFLHDIKLYDKISDIGEGYAYVGIVTICIFCILPIVFIYKKISARTKKIKRGTIHNEPTNISPLFLFIAFASLLLAMGIPFIWNMEWLLDYLSAFRQFRSLGRFNWIFYYIVTVYAVIALYNWYSILALRNKRVLAYSILILPIIIWSIEACGYINNQKRITKIGWDYYNLFFSEKQYTWQPEEKSWQEFLQENKHKKTDFQSILLLPFVHVGSDKLWLENYKSGWSMPMGYKAAMQLHLPMIDVLVARAAWPQAFAQVRIVAGPLADKPILNLVNNKPFLLMHFDEDSLDANSKYLLQSSDYIGHFSQCYIYACYPERIKANDKKYRDSIQKIIAIAPIGDTCINCKGDYHIEHFDKAGSPAKLFGAGAALPIKGLDSSIQFPLKPASDSELYEFSLWVLVNDYDYKSPSFFVNALDSNGKILSTTTIETKQSVDNNKFWLRAAGYINIPLSCRTIQYIIHNEPKPSYLAIDELLMRPADAIIISRSQAGEIMVNDHVFKK